MDTSPLEGHSPEGKEFTIPRTRPPYPPEFRARRVELVRAGRSKTELAREFEPAATSFRNWVRQADLDEGRRDDGSTPDEIDCVLANVGTSKL